MDSADDDALAKMALELKQTKKTLAEKEEKLKTLQAEKAASDKKAKELDVNLKKAESKLNL